MPGRPQCVGSLDVISAFIQMRQGEQPSIGFTTRQLDKVILLQFLLQYFPRQHFRHFDGICFNSDSWPGKYFADDQ